MKIKARFLSCRFKILKFKILNFWFIFQDRRELILCSQFALCCVNLLLIKCHDTELTLKVTATPPLEVRIPTLVEATTTPTLMGHTIMPMTMGRLITILVRVSLVDPLRSTLPHLEDLLRNRNCSVLYTTTFIVKFIAFKPNRPFYMLLLHFIIFDAFFC